ncbi:MAG: hypothetical protein AB7F86_18765 [Bdellovibrionales bacterium]
MAKTIMAAEPNLLHELEAAHEAVPQIVEAWNHEEEIFARGQVEQTENPRERVQNLIPGLDFKRLVL